MLELDTTLITPLIKIVFYLLIVVFVFVSLLGIYTLNRFGKSKITALVLSGIYIFISLSIFTAAIVSLNKLKL